MLLNINEGMENTIGETDELDHIIDRDPDTDSGLDIIANDVENLMMQSALESATYFENGEEAVKNFAESAEVRALTEARKLAKKTFVRLGRNDDLKRRANLAAIIIAKEKKDPLFRQLAINRVKERKLRSAIFNKYGNRAMLVARKSQKVHMKAMTKMPSLPMIKLN